MKCQVLDITLGILLSPLVAAVFLYLIIWASEGSIVPAPEILGFAYFVGLISVILIGLPVHLFMSRYKYISFQQLIKADE